MKKLLIGTAAVALVASFGAAPANAQVKLDVGGYTKMYVNWLDQDEPSNIDDAVAAVAASDESVDVRNFDMARDTEIHFTGETTLDNGLTVGFHTEAEADGSDIAGGGDSFDVQESYAYFSGAWGRVNVGAEDGATYLLQVAAPSADSNIDGLRQWINPVQYGALSNVSADFAAPTDNLLLQDLVNGLAVDDLVVDADGSGTATANDVRIEAAGAGAFLGSRLDYDHAASGYENKLTYMTPVFNGFQAGASYTPDTNSGIGTSGLNGNNFENQPGVYGSAWELAARYEGQFDQVGIALGGGWSHVELEDDAATPVAYVDVNGNANYDVAVDTVAASLDDAEAWNVGLDLNWMAFGLGAAYLNNDNGVSGDDAETETWVVGLDYTTGPFKLGASYLTQDQSLGSAEVESDRWTAGVIYTYGPGMTFRGSVSFLDLDENVGLAGSDADATSIVMGTQIDF